MSTSDVTTRATRREVYRWIADSDLPSPEGVSISDVTVFLDFVTIEDLDAWVAALSGKESCRRKLMESGELLSYYTYSGWLGYHGVLTCHEKPVSEERVEEILAHLNSFVAYEYEGVSDLVNGRAVHSAQRTGVLDSGLGTAVEWALDQPEVELTCGPDVNGGATVDLFDGTVIAWDKTCGAWVVEVSEAGESE